MEAPQTANITTIKTTNGELYVQGDTIIGRMETMNNITRYYRGDKLHRDGDLPAYIERNDAGLVIWVIYYRDGKKHRDGIVSHGETVSDLPAYIERNNAGAVICERYWRDGVEISPKEIKAATHDAELAAERAKTQALQIELDLTRACLEALKAKLRALVE